MKLLRYLCMMLLAVLGLALPAGCINDDITTSSSATLSFSLDTLSFDTVFTETGTPTARLLVYNRNSKGVNISQIRFRNADTRFSFNVDGMSGTEFHDVEIRAKDSIYVFVECYIDRASTDEPVFVEDQLDFITNGVLQSVQVEAWGQNVTRLRGLTIDTDTRLTADVPYVVFDSLIVAPGATLSIDPGARILFHDKAYLDVRGRIDAVGEPGKMIQLRGDRSDKVLPNLTYEEMSSQWKGITIAPSSFDNRLEYVDMRSTEQGLVIDSCGDLSRSKLTIVNSWLHNSAGHVLTSSHAQVNAYGVCFSDAALGVVSLSGGRHEFLQCTFANYYLFSAPFGPIIGLSGILPEETSQPMQAQFRNCIVAGMGSPLSPTDLAGSDVYFHYTLFQSGGEDDDHFLECLWDKDPLFLTDRYAYYFNYHVQPDSPALNAGLASFVTPECLYDMDGYDRLSFGAPTLGAYSQPQSTEKQMASY